MTTFKNGWIRQPKDDRDFKYTLRRETLIPLPVKADISQYLPPVFDQLSLSSCTANTGVSSLMAVGKKQGKKKVTYSRLFLYYFTRLLEGTENEDSGCYMRDVFKAANKYGVCSESYWKYDVRKVLKVPTATANKAVKIKAIQYELLPQKIDYVKDCIASGFPVITGIDIFDSFDSMGTHNKWILPKPSGDIQGGHAIIIFSYDDNTKLLGIRNSWGETWGDKGNFYMPYSYFESKYCDDSWTLKEVS
jgi:C1A family cysteine protease